jgi:hypothetical protein
MPYENFDAIKTESDLMEFFNKYFPDSIPLMGEERLKKEYFRNPKGSLMSVKVIHFYEFRFFFNIIQLYITLFVFDRECNDCH